MRLALRTAINARVSGLRKMAKSRRIFPVNAACTYISSQSFQAIILSLSIFSAPFYMRVRFKTA